MKIALFGAGRIGKVHAATISANPRAELASVVDPHHPSAERLAAQYQVPVMPEAEALADPGIDAVLIASSTDQHARQIVAAANAGKAIFCEKPIDLDLARVRGVVSHLEANPVPFMISFNRRFDPNFVALKAQIEAGAIGQVELVTLLSRDPGLPSIDYIRRSGGLFRDMMIHDFDMARFLVGEEFSEVTALGSVLIDPQVGEAGDIDSAGVMLKTASGKLVSITNSRRATYGYDQRIEVQGSRGMLQAENLRESTVILSNAAGVRLEKPLHFFLERYAQAYVKEVEAFVGLVLEGDRSPRSTLPSALPSAQDGLKALELAEMAAASLSQKRTADRSAKPSRETL